jgi:Family of unknown function (DUF5682)
LQGFAARAAFDREQNADQLQAAARLALSPAVPPSDASDWILGALKGPVVVLQHGELLSVLNRWLVSTSEDSFVQLLPSLRRAFTAFTPTDRGVIADRIARAQSSLQSAEVDQDALPLDAERVAIIMPTLLELFS